MQEEVEQKSLTLTVNAAKMTARLFRAAIAKYVAHKKEKKHDAQTGVRYVGRQSVKKLVGQNQGVSNVELGGEDIKASLPAPSWWCGRACFSVPPPDCFPHEGEESDGRAGAKTAHRPRSR